MTKYRNSDSKLPPRRCDCASSKKQPGAFMTVRGRSAFWRKTSGICAPQDDTIESKKTHTPFTHSATRTDKRPEGHSKLLGKLAVSWCSGVHEERHAGTRSRAFSRPPAAQVVQRGPHPRIYHPSFDLERSAGPKGAALLLDSE